MHYPPWPSTADINNAKGVNAWPLSGYTYLIMHKNTLRPNATCANVKAPRPANPIGFQLCGTNT